MTDEIAQEGDIVVPKKKWIRRYWDPLKAVMVEEEYEVEGTPIVLGQLIVPE